MKHALLVFSFFLISCAIIPKAVDKNLLKKGELAMATREEGLVVCRRAELEACGIRLSDCSTQLKYECTISVIVIDMADLPTSPTF